MVFALTSACNCGSLAEADGWLESARRDGRDHFITGSAVTFAGNALDPAGAPEAWTATFCGP